MLCLCVYTVLNFSVHHVIEISLLFINHLGFGSAPPMQRLPCPPVVVVFIIREKRQQKIKTTAELFIQELVVRWSCCSHHPEQELLLLTLWPSTLKAF